MKGNIDFKKKLFLYRQDYTKFIVYLPQSPCSSACSWCDFPKNPSMVKDWAASLYNTIQILPSHVKNCVIAGCEPTMNKEFITALRIIESSQRFKKVTVISNGIGLLSTLLNGDARAIRRIDRVELLRHSTSDLINRNLFNNSAVPYCTAVRDIGKLLKQRQVQFGLRYYITDGMQYKDVVNFISYAKDMSADDVIFCKIPDDSLRGEKIQIDFEDNFDIKSTSFTPLESVSRQVVADFSIFWHSELRAPNRSHFTDFAYDLHFQSNGLLTADRLGDIPLILKQDGSLYLMPTFEDIDVDKIAKIKKAQEHFNDIIYSMSGMKESAKNKVRKKIRRILKGGKNITGFQVGKNYYSIDLKSKDGKVFFCDNVYQTKIAEKKALNEEKISST